MNELLLTRIRSWLWPSWKRVLWLAGGGLLLAGLLVLSRAWWLPLVAQWQYWRMGALRDARQRGATAGMRTFREHPWSFELPLPERLLDNGTWARAAARAALERLRPLYPQDTALIDEYLACWEFWSGDPQRARAELERLGRPLDPVLFALRAQDRAALAELAADPAVARTNRARAWWALAQQAERAGRGQEAAAAYLQTLENAVSGGAGAATIEPAWEAVRQRVGTEISAEDYRATLVRMAQRVHEPRWVEEVMFELGKLKMLAKEEAKS